MIARLAVRAIAAAALLFAAAGVGAAGAAKEAGLAMSDDLRITLADGRSFRLAGISPTWKSARKHLAEMNIGEWQLRIEIEAADADGAAPTAYIFASYPTDAAAVTGDAMMLAPSRGDLSGVWGFIGDDGRRELFLNAYLVLRGYARADGAAANPMHAEILEAVQAQTDK